MFVCVCVQNKNQTARVHQTSSVAFVARSWNLRRRLIDLDPGPGSNPPGGSTEQVSLVELASLMKAS